MLLRSALVVGRGRQYWLAFVPDDALITSESGADLLRQGNLLSTASSITYWRVGKPSALTSVSVVASSRVGVPLEGAAARSSLSAPIAEADSLR